jgi:hypothetical protein
MGARDPQDVTRDMALDLSILAGELSALKGDAALWLDGPEHAALRRWLEDAHVATEAALFEARRLGGMDEEQEG